MEQCRTFSRYGIVWIQRPVTAPARSITDGGLEAIGATSLAPMGNGNGEPDDRPATWENELVGELKKLTGRAIRDKELADEGEEQAEIAREVREEYGEKRDD